MKHGKIHLILIVDDLKEEKGSCPGLLEWKVVQQKLPWLVIILLGGSFAMAAGCKVRS